MLWNKADVSSLRYDFNIFCSNFVLQSFPDVNSCWTVFRNDVIQLMKTYVPNRITRSRKTNAWMNTETRRIVCHKNRTFIIAQFTMSPMDLQRYKYLKSRCKRFICQACNTYIQNIVCHYARKNPSNFGSFVKSKKQDASGVAPLYDGQDGLCSDPLTKSTILGKHIQSVFTNENFSTMPRLNMSSYPTMSHMTIHASGVKNLLRNLNSHKATGPDAIPAHLLSELSAEVTPALAFVFQMSFNTSDS